MRLWPAMLSSTCDRSDSVCRRGDWFVAVGRDSWQVGGNNNDHVQGTVGLRTVGLTASFDGRDVFAPSEWARAR